MEFWRREPIWTTFGSLGHDGGNKAKTISKHCSKYKIHNCKFVPLTTTAALKAGWRLNLSQTSPIIIPCSTKLPGANELALKVPTQELAQLNVHMITQITQCQLIRGWLNLLSQACCLLHVIVIITDDHIITLCQVKLDCMLRDTL